MIANISAAPGGTDTGTELVKALIGRAAESLPDITTGKDLSALTGKTLDTAESARKDALAASQAVGL